MANTNDTTLTALDQLINDTKSELARLHHSYGISLKQLIDRAQYDFERHTASGYASTHTGHNLGSQAGELQELAAKIDQTTSVLSSVLRHAETLRALSGPKTTGSGDKF